MEKKTTGRFIAALRRANGLTRRELAEKLSVSDKAVSREAAYTRTIVNSDGEVVCEYQHYNENVIGVRYPVTETCLPIRVTTWEQQVQAVRTAEKISVIFCCFYPLEVTAGFLAYFIKRKKLK